jgi:hypothetical protein
MNRFAKSPKAEVRAINHHPALGESCSMGLYKTDIRFGILERTWVLLHSVLLFLPLFICLEGRESAHAQSIGTPVSDTDCPLTIQQVVENLARMNLERARALRAFSGTRTYRVEYRGFPSTSQRRDGCESRIQNTNYEGIHNTVCDGIQDHH